VRAGESVLALLGNARLDLTDRPPAEGTRPSATAVFGSVDVIVSPGAWVSLGGVSIIGSREQRVTPGDGPTIHVTAHSILGSVQVREPKVAG
jgi:hypothetical protein